MNQANQRVWLFLVAVFCLFGCGLAGCGGGFGIFNEVKIDKVYPRPDSTDVPLNVEMYFRVRPNDVWTDVDIWYRDHEGRMRSVSFRWRVQEKWDEKIYHIEFYEYLKPNTKYEVRIEADAYDMDNDYASYHFITGNRTE